MAILVLLFLGVNEICMGQNNSSFRIVSSNLGSSGSSQTIFTSKGNYKISQSIGQSSVIGTHSNNSYFIRQGYQQPLSQVAVTKTIDLELIAKVHPNPFRHQVIIAFNAELKDTVSILIVDITGKVIRNQSFQPSRKIELQLADISVGTYILKIISGGKSLDQKLIKI